MLYKQEDFLVHNILILKKNLIVLYLCTLIFYKEKPDSQNLNCKPENIYWKNYD